MIDHLGGRAGVELPVLIGQRASKAHEITGVVGIKDIDIALGAKEQLSHVPVLVLEFVTENQRSQLLIIDGPRVLNVDHAS